MSPKKFLAIALLAVTAGLSSVAWADCPEDVPRATQEADYRQRGLQVEFAAYRARRILESRQWTPEKQVLQDRLERLEDLAREAVQDSFDTTCREMRSAQSAVFRQYLVVAQAALDPSAVPPSEQERFIRPINDAVGRFITSGGTHWTPY